MILLWFCNYSYYTGTPNSYVLQVHPSGEIIRLEHYCPWKEHIFQLEEVLAVTPSIKFVLYQSEGENEKWRIQVKLTLYTLS